MIETIPDLCWSSLVAGLERGLELRLARIANNADGVLAGQDWQRTRDSNPRGVAPNTLSKRAP
jgi:hypothetical protein